ncbi:DNA-binding MarR family transcriptional regulator [Actinoplanes lutulentus]|uniref:DNA-binding MarR family transcriptional regulator n=1 Tax=Actinoplanes lutulentus TaxID=1287878 RepID=A0A327Z0K1_9ACTN|nr:MarR family transcriptional regulator [Actinoplanes lutulentus]MBB2946459.1 DNA-binding MarR family transcriptional regulator [Actinoplanes lutulentus]RAK25435.1 DNA-binding MarR family transcriptional regulator [Actinoplanes lutulentus]
MSSGANPLALEKQVGYALSLASRAVVAVYRPLLTAVGLTHAQYLVMLALWQHGPMSVRRLGRLLQHDSGTLSPLLQRLEALGFVRRDRDPADQRGVTVTVTAEGYVLRSRVESIPSAVQDRLGMPVEEIEHLHAVLGDVVAVARSAASEETPR